MPATCHARAHGCAVWEVSGLLLASYHVVAAKATALPATYHVVAAKTRRPVGRACNMPGHGSWL